MKKILLSLFWIITLWLVNFWYCVNFSDFITYLSSSTSTVNPNGFHTVLQISDSSDYWTYCIKVNSFNGPSWVANYFIWSDFWYWNTLTYDANWTIRFFWDYEKPFYVCSYTNNPYLYLYNSSNYTFTISYDLFKLNTLLDTPVPVMSSNECKSTYNLVDISLFNSCQSDLAIATWNLASCESDLSTCYYDYWECESDLLTCQNDLINCWSSECPIIDTQYCMINWLCPSVSGSWTSSIYIYSDNQYTPLNSANNIFVNLPSYVWYNYSYSNWWNDLDITVWYAVDTWYIENINSLQNYKPTSEDFTELLWVLAPYSKILIFCVFMFIIWAWIKKPFKSKRI